jgi:hypothetical protein
VVKANGQDVVDGEPVRLNTLADTLRLEADIASNVGLKSITLERTDPNGTRAVPDSEYTLTPAFPDTARTGTGGRRYHLSFFTRLEVGSYRYTIGTVDTNGVPGHFDVVFKFLSILHANGVPLIDRDKVAPGASLSLIVISPRPIDHPDTEFGLTLFGPGSANGVPVPFTPAPLNQDPSGREWQLSWTHQPYPPGEYRLELSVAGQFTIITLFRVEARMALENAFAFPNPFDEELGTHFSFYLTSEGPSDVLLRVYTVSGRLVYDWKERGMQPGYHQIPWDGREVANGIYLYRLQARNPAGSTMHEGRLVKLRKPTRYLEGQ